MACESEADILGFGGAAGPGKTTMLIGLGVTRHRRTIIFRREKEQVRDIWDKLGRICGARGRSNENLLLWRDLPGDRQVRLGGVKDEHDWRRYMGHENDLYGFDELTEFSENQFRTLTAWNRTTILGQRCRVVTAFNPPTSAEGEWVIAYFAPWLDGQHSYPAEPGELRWYAMLDGEEQACDDGAPFTWKGETLYPKSRTFIPARLEDNPILEATGYRAVLQNLPEPRRSQLLYGDFSIGREADPWQCIPTDWVRRAQARWTPERPRHESGQPYALRVVAVDPSEGGSDRFVLARRYGTWWPEPEVHPGSLLGTLGLGEDLQERQLVERGGPLVLRALVEGGVATIDADGIGASLASWVSWRTEGRASSFRGSAKTNLTDRSERLTFVNLRAAAYWRMREWLDPELGYDLALPPGRGLLAELCAPHYRMTTAGVQLEPKKDIAKRLGRSPDEGDAFVMSLFSTPSSRPVEFRVSLG